MKRLSLLIHAAVLALALWTTTATAKTADPICLMRKCGGPMLRCGFESECASWLSCVIQCGEDKIRCPSFCGFFYQSKRINRTNQCIFDSQCVDLGFDQYPLYDHAEGNRETLDGVNGTFWLAGVLGGKQIFDVDCQRFDFTAAVDETLGVHYSVPLTYNGKSRIREARGVFRALADGAIEVIYDNFVGYHEKWYIIDKSEDTLLARVCIGNDRVCYDYGTLLLARDELHYLPPAQRVSLDQAVQAHLGVNLRDFRRTQVLGCTNRPDSRALRFMY